MLRKAVRIGVSLASIIALASCGGGSGGSAGGTPPTPVPTPPAPPPPPPPPPPVVISAVSSFAMIGQFRFFRTGSASNVNNADYGSFPSDQGGFYPRQNTPLVETLFSGSVPANYATVEKLAFGFDTASGLYSGSAAPADATVISPVTNLLLGTNTEAKLERQLGISSGLFSLATDRPIKTFSPSLAFASSDPSESADAERLIAHQLRILAVTAALGYMGGNGLDPSGFRLREVEVLQRFLDTAPDQFIYTNDRMSQILRASPYTRSTYTDEVISAAAHLVDAYCSSIGVRTSTPQQAARWQLGIWGYLIPELTRLLKANNSVVAAEILAVNNSQILDATQRYNEQIAVSASQGFFPQPDFYPIAVGGTYLVPAVDEGSNGDGPLNSNDLALRSSATNGIGGGALATTVTAITVPAGNATQVSAILNADGTVRINALGTFSGVTYFDYTVRLNYTSETRQSRVYVIVR